MKRDLISITDLAPVDIKGIFYLTDKLKKDKSKFSKVLAGKILALIFQKSSNRTRVSFEVGMYELGGYSIYLGPDQINLGVRESIKDVARTLSRYVNGIVLRTFAHANILEMAKYSSVSVINGLSDASHPCQALADVYTIREHLKELSGVKLAYVGDGNNVCHSLMYACAKSGIDINIATPKGYAPDKQAVALARTIAKSRRCAIQLFNCPDEAVKNSDVIYTDVWASMGQERELEKRKKVFRDFQVNRRLIKLAKPDALIMHCLPAHRGQEITDEAMESANSIIFEQAENRLHVQKAILIKLLKC